MRITANIFLLLFLFAAILGVVDESLNLLAISSPLGGLRSLAYILCLIFGLLVYFGFAVNKRLPKLILGPLLLALGWGLLDFWPLEIVAGPSYRLYAVGGELLLVLLLLKLNRARNKKSRLLVLSQFPGPRFSWWIFSRFCLVSIVTLPLIIMLLAYSTAGTLLERHTAGFIRLQPNGLYMTEKSYQQATKTIRLASMIHLGQRDYYTALIDSISGERVIVLAEGVSDVSGRLQGTFSYARIADLLGLAAQEQIPFQGRLVTSASLDQRDNIIAGSIDILRADIDLQEFDDRTIAVLNALGRYLLEGPSLSQGYQDFNRWAVDNMTPETNRVIMQDLVEKRNSTVLSYLPKALQKYDTVVIPWGALHMAGLEKAVLVKGFRLQKSHERLSIDFLLLPYADLWKLISGNAAESGS